MIGKPNMEKVQSKDGTPIAFDKLGQGPALILVGGALQYRAIDPRTAQLAERLAEQFTVFHYDRRGRGDSGNTLPFAKERELEDLDALLREAGGSAFVFAMSSGGALALDAAAQGFNITKLALYEPPFIVDDSRPPLPTDYVEHLTELSASGRSGDAVAFSMTQAAGVPPEFVEQMRTDPFWGAFEAVAHTLAYDGAFVADTMMGKPLPTMRWRSVSVPTLVLDGGASHEHMHTGAQALVELLPNSKRRTLEGQQHDVAPEVLAPVLAEFFTS
jgi:pimeloyl-ACP methyl ester carboxylesterase